jgi:hypothetical protein
MSIWYWHFVDVVWIFLFLMLYWWGNSTDEVTLITTFMTPIRVEEISTDPLVLRKLAVEASLCLKALR